MTRPRFLLLLALAIVTATLAGRAQAPAASAAPKIEFEKYTLPNGLQVVLHVDRKLPIVHVNEWFHVGSKNEKPGRTGFAHLFEHMMFEGSKDADGGYWGYAEKAGANVREGGVNGTTNSDRTNYFITVPSGSLEHVLWLESDRIATLLDVTDQKKLDNQRDVVKNERRQSLENQPYGRAFILLFDSVFPAGHPYHWPVIGSQEDLTAASLADVKDFFRQYYAPNNLSMVIAGDFDPAEAKRLVEKYFGDIPPGPPLDRPSIWVPTLSGERTVDVNDHVALERVHFAWPSPGYFTPDDAALDIAARILSDGLSSRLNRALVYDQQLATAVAAFNATSEIASMFVVQATARPGVPLAKIEPILTSEIARLAKEGPTAVELDRAKTKQESEFISGLERIGGFGGKADVLNLYNTFLGDPGNVDADINRYRALTPGDIQRAVSKWIDTPNRAVLRFHPDASKRPANAMTFDRSKMPPLGDDRPFVAPAVQSAKLANGLQVFVVERHDLPKVNVRIVSRAGAASDPVDKLGVANLALATIHLGTPTRKALEIEDGLGALGTELAANPGREGAALSFDVLRRNLAPAMEIVSDVVQHPTFPADEFAREKKRVLDQLAQADRSGNALVQRIQPMLAFGPTHPYGRPVAGLKSTVEAITREDLVQFHQARWRPGSTALIIAGDITLADATALATKTFDGWTGGAAPLVTVPPPAPAPAGRLYLVDRPDAAQTVVAQYLPAPTRTSPDYDALTLVDAVWGGGGVSTRLNLNLRENKGYSYGVFSSFNPMRMSGNWFAGGGIQTDKTAPAIVEFDKEMKDLAGAKPISADELAVARQRRMRGYAQRFESLDRVTGEIANLWVIGMPLVELQREYDGTGKQTLDQVLAAEKKYVTPSASSMLLVGDRAKIEKDVKALNVGEVVLLDAEGRTVAKN